MEIQLELSVLSYKNPGDKNIKLGITTDLKKDLRGLGLKKDEKLQNNPFLKN